MNNEINGLQIWNIIRKYILVIILTAVIGGGAGFAIAKFAVSPTYSASTSLLINRGTSESNGLNGGTQAADLQIIGTYKDLIVSDKVLNDASNNLDNSYSLSADQLKKMITLTNETGSQVLSVSVKSKDAEESAAVANAVADSFKNHIGDIMKIKNVSIVDKATDTKNQVGPNVNAFILGGLVILGGLTFLVVVIKELSESKYNKAKHI